ncbi:putative type IX secretion system sortase PorU2 [Hymenobacter ruricola]|uniref:Gingipain domain-containing protein n=1 Tax=Hymenobacter ruricola TaxID=2791023 RepID=A0ABS0I7Y9_9BACT|nr:C25 family cysteine peptidase [Hymenobacter ruricola]MBF9223089.1 hypothetical protein [Hymenobacter ruricola]
MHKNYGQLLQRGKWWLVALVLWLGWVPARAQTPAQVGNEWIVPGQTYYKVKILKDGLYKLDYQYLIQAGITGVAPSQLQIWRRGREVAAYGGGNQAVLDPTSFIEFYAVHNDGKLDVELYKRPQDQPHQYYNYYTDTASYFITWKAGQQGRRMAQPTAAGGAVHPHRLHNQLNLRLGFYIELPTTTDVYLPWVEAAEGYFHGGGLTAPNDSVIRAVAPAGPAPKVEVQMYGASNNSTAPLAHAVEVLVGPAGSERSLGVMRWSGRVPYKQTFTLLRSDIVNGVVLVTTRKDASALPGDDFYSSYARFIVPQANRWFGNRHSVVFQNDSTLAGPATYEFDNDSIPATVAGFDVQDFYNVQRVVSTATGTRRRFVFPAANAATHTLLLADEATPARPPLPARRVTFRTINPALANFIIITHPQLMKPAGGFSNAALEYAKYRANPGRSDVPRYDTLMVTSFQLYDQFGYGDRSWLAMRHFARWMAAASPVGSQRYLLLLGKGQEPSDGGGRFFTDIRYAPRTLGEQGTDLVPTSTRAVSDNLLTADFMNNDFAAKLNTGRLTVTTPAQIILYLNKLRDYERAGDQPWRKNVLHLTGGTDTGQFTEFRNYVNAYKQHVESPLFGGRVVNTIERLIVNPVGNSLLVDADITNDLNAGLGVIQYFGHGSQTSFSLDIGTPTKNQTYNNPGKYPVMMFDGCLAGNLYTKSPTFFEDWLFTANKGAIGCMGTTGFGFPGYLNLSKDLYTKLLYNDPLWYGKPFTAVYNETVRQLQRSGGAFDPANLDDIATEQLLGTVWHGDPAISLYAPAQPDFQVSNSTLAIRPVGQDVTVTANSTTFSLLIGVSNPRRVTLDSVRIRVTRTVGTNPPLPPYTKVFAQGPQGSATYDFRLPNPSGTNVFGANTFAVEIDYPNRVAESDETNNTATISHTFLRGGVTLLSPAEFAIVGNSQPRLVAQTNDPQGSSRAYEFEADTSAAFTSPLKRASGTVTATLTPSWRPTLPAVAGRDSVVWYWRARFQAPSGDEDASWAVSSFRVVQGRSAGGWSQSHYAQFRRDQRNGVEVTPSGHWDFSTQNAPLLLRTTGGGLPGAAPNFLATSGLGIIANVLAPPTLGGCARTAQNAPNLLVAVYDEHTLKPIAGLPATAVCGQAPQEFYIFGTNPANPGDTLNTLNNSATQQAQLTSFLAAVPDGAYVAMVSMNRLRWASIAPVRTAFSTLLGSQLVNQLQNGDPFALVAQKRAAGGRVLHEVGPSTAAGSGPRYSQLISLSDTLRTPSTQGTITSVRIGPAKSWENLYHWIQREPNATSSYTLRVIGIDTLNQSRVVVATVPAGSPSRGGYSLNTISASQYPYLQLELTMQDTLGRHAPQLKEWFITYQGVPEGVVRRDLAQPSNAYDPATLVGQALGGELKIPVVFENVTPFSFGTPLRAKIELTEGSTTRPPVYVTLPRQVKGDSTVRFTAKVPMIGVFGKFTTKVTVNAAPKAQPEQYLFNNELNLSEFLVVDPNLPPTLDVAIDGRHILNGELVSARPVIHIQLNDEDKLRHITDRSFFTVTMQRPGQSGATPINLNGNDVDFSVDVSNGSIAQLTYEPGKAAPLPDGMYTLKVQGRDPSNSAAGSQEFQVKFEVVNTSQISNVYPYPNPVVSKARFVFTLTGQQLPNNMKIQIMSLTGRVVREIFMSELGPLHIGNNISEYAWDGTDTYGDRLANGTYLYRVALDDPNGDFKHRATAGDQAFKNDWGKLVLMR